MVFATSRGSLFGHWCRQSQGFWTGWEACGTFDPTGRRRRNLSSRNAKRLEFLPTPDLTFRFSADMFDDRRFAGQVGTNGDRSNTVSSGPLTW